MKRLALVLILALVALMAVPAVASWPTVAQQPEYVTLAGANGANDQIPHGVPSTWKQYSGSVASWLNTPCYGMTGACPYTYGDPYMQVYTAATGNPQPDVKIEICHLQAWTLDGQDVWHSLYAPDPQIGGAWFQEPFGASTGGIYDRSVPGCLIVQMKSGYLFHGWVNGRGRVDPLNIKGLVAAAEIRILPGSYDPNGPTPNLIADAGFDFWDGPSCCNSHTSGQGRFKTLGTGWRWYLHSTLTIAQLHAGLLPPMQFDPATMF